MRFIHSPLALHRAGSNNRWARTYQLFFRLLVWIEYKGKTSGGVIGGEVKVLGVFLPQNGELVLRNVVALDARLVVELIGGKVVDDVIDDANVLRLAAELAH